jgi:hypothetical protein
MSSLFVIRSLFNRVFPSPGRSRRRQAKTPRADRRIPLLAERLEDRTLFTVNPILGINGIGSASSFCGCSPPDTTGAAGPSSYIETVNASIAIYNKITGAVIAGPTSFANFFSSLGSPVGTGDPIIVYNEVTGKFGFGQLDSHGIGVDSRLDFAISKTSNPATLTTADWDMARFNTDEGPGSGRFSDYPKIGYNADGFVVSFNMFITSITYAHVSTLSITNALTSPGMKVVPGGTSRFTLAPASMHSTSPGDPMWFVTDGHGSSAGSTITVFRMDNPFSASPTFTPSILAVTAYGAAPNPRQPSGSLGNQTSLGTRFYFSGLRTVSGVTHLVSAHAAGAGGGVQAQWFDIRVSGALAMLQQGFINQGAGVDTYFPDADIAPDGSIGLQFSESSANEFMSMYVTGRSPDDPANTMQTPVLAKAGLANLNAFNRAGDYSFTTIDPVDGTFWGANEWANTGGAPNWATWVEHWTLAVVHTPPIVTPPVNQTGTEGLSVTVNLGSFTDPDSSPYSVDVNWGDGSSHDTFNQGSDGSLGSRPHTYAEEGAKTVTVTVTNSANQSDSKTFTINVADAALSPSIATVNGSENVALNSVAVATFTDLGGAEPTGDYSATINWGDGNASAGTVQSDGAGGFIVLGSNTYAEEGTYAITVTISHDSAGSFTANSTAVIADAALTATGTTISETTGAPFTDTVATFTDANPVLDLGDFSARINYGDGSPPVAAVVSQAGTTFNVASDGTFSYAVAGTYTMTVTITDVGGSTATATGTAIVTDGGGGGGGGGGARVFRGHTPSAIAMPFGNPPGGSAVGTEWSYRGPGQPVRSAVPQYGQGLRVIPGPTEQGVAVLAGPSGSLRRQESKAADDFWTAFRQPVREGFTDSNDCAVFKRSLTQVES